MKKHHKPHRHKDGNHKRSSRSKNHHKHKKEHRVSESVLEPVQEIFKEKEKIDKNACGDYANSFLAPPIEADQKSKSKHRRERGEKADKVEKLESKINHKEQEEFNIFSKNYRQKLEESADKKLARYSLEKSGENLINKTKNFFRKEKSFNDAVQKVSVDLKENNEREGHRKRRHISKKSEKSEEKKEKRDKRHEKSSKKEDKKERKGKSQEKKEKREKSAKKSIERSKKSPSPSSGQRTYNRVQEVIYCQLDQVPYKLKNDKSAAEIKDLYQRIKREKRHHIGMDNTKKDNIFHSYEDGKNNQDLEKDSRYQSPFTEKTEIIKGKKNERFKSHSKRVIKEHTQREERRTETRSKEHKNHKRHRHHEEGHIEDLSKVSADRKRKKDSLSNIDLGPYHKYFAFENKNIMEQCHKKHRKTAEENKKANRSSKEKKHKDNQEQLIFSMEYDHTPCKKGCEKHEGNSDQKQENKLETDEEKIHQIVEGDLKTYFFKIQHMIDKKLDGLLQIKKSKHEKISNKNEKEQEGQKRSKSKDKKSDKEERTGSKKENSSKKVDKSKHKTPEGKHEDIAKEEIIQEVLNRIKTEVQKEKGDKEKKSISEADRKIATKHESKEMPEKIQRDDRKNFKDFKDVSPSSRKREDISADQKINNAHSKNQALASIQKLSSKRHRDSLKNLKQRDPSLLRRFLDKKQQYDDTNIPQDHENIKGSRSPDYVFRSNNLTDHDVLSSLTPLDQKSRSREKRSLPKNSLVYTKNVSSPPSDLVTPAAEISSLEWKAHLKSLNPLQSAISDKEKELSHHSLKKHYTSSSSCRACSGHQFMSPAARSEEIATHPHNQKHVVSDEVQKDRYYPGDRRSSSPERGCRAQEINFGGNTSIHMPDHRFHEMVSAKHDTYSAQEHMGVSRPEDYIMAPQNVTKHNDRIKDYDVHKRYHEPSHRRSDVSRSKRDILVQYTDPKLENIILPPEMFRTSAELYNPSEQLGDHDRLESSEYQHPKQEFLVQGIEPPILESFKKESGRKLRARNLECKTVSIVGIPPQTTVTELPICGQAQTKTKYQKSVNTDQDLVEKRKKSKRFKLYYKYSTVNSIKENVESGTSDARSIVSDSYKAISDPSDEERTLICNSRDVKRTKEIPVSPESQVLNITQKKWNKVGTPRDSHLNNIIEEPSTISNSVKKDDDYFIPIRGINECYFKSFTSCHSEYCFKIDKKSANSNISIVSKDTCDERYQYNNVGRCRYCKQNSRSKSYVNMVSNGHDHGIQIFKSKSDVFLGGASGKKVIRSIFYENIHPYAKARKSKARHTQNSELQNANTGSHGVRNTSCKDCQTSNEKVIYDFVPVDEGESHLAFEDKQKLFKDIYKTIDNLEENIHSSRQAPPKTLDVAVSSKFLSLDKISDKKSQFKEIYDTIDNLQNKMIDTSNKKLVQTIDVAIGSPVRTYRNQRISRSEPRKTTHEIAVGDSKDQVAMKATTRERRPQSSGKRLKSAGFSPIIIVENQQNSSIESSKKGVTPMTPNTRNHVARPLTRKPAKNLQNTSPLKKTVPKTAETKKEPTCSSNLSPRVMLVQNTKMKLLEKAMDNEDHNIMKHADDTQLIHGVKVFRSEEKSSHLKKRENRPRDRNAKENITNMNNEKDTIHQKQPCIIVNRPEDVNPVVNVTKNNTEISSKASERKYAPKEKGDVPKKALSRNRMDDVRKSCIHHYHPRDLQVQKTSKTATATERTPAGTTKQPITVNTALFKCRLSSQREALPSEESTSSSLGDDSAHSIRRSKSMVEVQTQRKEVHRSKSEIIKVIEASTICKSGGFETNGGSIFSGNMEKFANIPRLRCHSPKSNVNSLDQFIGNKFTSRLFLTKDFKGGEISAYQRRKLYDQAIRQKMKRKFRFSKMDVGPQVFEVRFLSMVNQETAQRKEKEPKEKHNFNKSLSTLNLDKVKTNGPVCQKEKYNSNRDNNEGESSKEIGDIAGNENSSIFEETRFVDNKKSIYSLVHKDSLKLTNELQSAVNMKKHENKGNYNEDVVIKNMNIKSDDISVTELYFKDQKINQEKLLRFCNKLLEVNSSLELPDEFKGSQCTCSKYSENCQSCKNFVNLMDILCSSVASYCNSKSDMLEFKLENGSKSRMLENNDDCESNTKSNTTERHYAKEEFDDLHVYSPNFAIQEASNTVQEIFSRSGNDSLCQFKDSSDQSDKMFKNVVECVSLATTNKTDIPSLSHPLSCPVLPTNSSSFEFLYEETSSVENEGICREIVLADLTRPFEQTFNFSMSQYNVETPFLRRNSYFNTTRSSESGYASIKSRSCRNNSLTNFFKKPKIAALFKTPVLTRTKSDLSKFCEQKGQGDFRESRVYKEMTKSCQLYAKKVRETCEMKLAENVDDYQEFSLAFLLGQNSSVVLESTALGQNSSTHVALISNKDIQLSKMEIIEYETNKGTDELPNAGDKTDEYLKNNEESFVENGCRLILSNECLNIESFTRLGPDIFNEESLEPRCKVSKEFKKNFNNATDKMDVNLNNDDDSTLMLDFAFDSNNPFVPSKDTVTRNFFETLLKVYDTGIEISNELFKNNDFLKNVLLPAVEERKNEEKKSKKGRLSRFFRKKQRDNQTNIQENKYEQTSEASAKLRSLASNAKKCFTMLAQAVKINGSIDDEIKICGLLKMLERIECGDFLMIKNVGDSNIEQDIKSQVKEAFVNIYEICEKEAKKAKRNFGDQEINLIKGFVTKYRVGLLSKTNIVACYIGRGVIQTEAQLKAAITYLMRSQANEVNIKEFEEYCNFTKSF